MGIIDLFRLTDKVALVTGAAKGIGQALAVALAEAGADIACLDILPCDDTKAQVTALGRRFFMVSCDLITTKISRFDEIVNDVIKEFGRLDILVNNAGITRPNPAMDITEQDYDDEFQINQKALFFLSRAAARRMVQSGGGKIINIDSTAAFYGGVGASSYTGTKGAVASYTRAFASEWAELGINVNAIAPGWMKTDNTTNLLEDPETYAAIVNRIPAGRWGIPTDLQGVAVFLASAASDYLHGSIIIVDGGWLVR